MGGALQKIEMEMEMEMEMDQPRERASERGHVCVWDRDLDIYYYFSVPVGWVDD